MLYILIVYLIVSEISGWDAKHIFESWLQGVSMRTFSTLVVIVYTICVSDFR